MLLRLLRRRNHELAVTQEKGENTTSQGQGKGRNNKACSDVQNGPLRGFSFSVTTRSDKAVSHSGRLNPAQAFGLSEPLPRTATHKHTLHPTPLLFPGFHGKSSGEGFEEKTTPPGIPAVVLLFLSV